MSAVTESCKAIEAARNQITLSRGILNDLGHARPGYRDQLREVEGLLTCGLVVLAEIRDQIIRNEAGREAVATVNT